MQTTNPQCIEIVTVGEWSDRRFDGVVIKGRYYSKGEARSHTNSDVRAAYNQARVAIRNDDPRLSDAPRQAYLCDSVRAWHHTIKY